MTVRLGERSKFQQPFDPVTAILFKMIQALTFFFVLAVLFMNPEVKKGLINPKAEYIITTSWEDGSPDDIDLWIEDPKGNLVWPTHPRVGQRDDILQRVQRTQFFRLERGQVRYAFLQRRENLNPLDRVDAQIVIEAHPEVQHLNRITRLLGDDGEDGRCQRGTDGKVEGRGLRVEGQNGSSHSSGDDDRNRNNDRNRRERRCNFLLTPDS